MPTYRTLRTDDERRQHAAIAAYAFTDDRSEAGLDRRIAANDADWCYAAFDGDEMVAGLVVIPFEQHLNGARIPMGAVASVSCLPERRRQGFVGGLVRHALAEMRDRGQPLSALYTPHTALYRRYGYETASRIVSYAFTPKRVRLRIAAGGGRATPGGAMRRVTADDWRTLAAVYDARVAGLNGPLVRDERRWRHVLHEGRDAAVWHDAAGEPRGYLVYRMRQRSRAEGWPSEAPYQQLRVVDWAALDAPAYAGVLDYLLHHDLAHAVVIVAGPDEPLLDAFEEPGLVDEPHGAWRGYMLRLVDVKRAVEARPALPQASGKAVTVALADDSAPWNAGTWRIESSEGRMSCERSDAAAEVEMDVATLAPIYNGHLRPSEAVRIGALRAASPGAVAALAELFAVSASPFCPDEW